MIKIMAIIFTCQQTQVDQSCIFFFQFDFNLQIQNVKLNFELILYTLESNYFILYQKFCKNT